MLSQSVLKPFYLDLNDRERVEIQQAVARILDSGKLLLGPETEAFEHAFASYIGVKHAISTNSGTSALEIILRAKGVAGKRVAVPTNTNFATVAAVMHAGGIPVMLDMSPDTFMPTLDNLRDEHEREPLAGAVWVHIGA